MYNKMISEISLRLYIKYNPINDSGIGVLQKRGLIHYVYQMRRFLYKKRGKKTIKSAF